MPRLSQPRRLVLPAMLLGLVLVCLPRFDRRDLRIGSFSATPSSPVAMADAEHYVALIAYLRGDGGAAPLAAPFAYRLVGPLLASLLPFAPMTALNLVNLAALAAATILLDRALRRLGAAEGTIAAGCALFIFSFPTLYYGTVGYVDPVLVCFLCAFVLAISARNESLAAAALVAGCLAKETMFVVVPAYMAFVFLRSRPRTLAPLLRATVVLAAASLAALAVSHTIPVGENLSHGPSWHIVGYNLSRLRAWLSVALTFGGPGVAAAYLICRKASRDRLLRHPSGIPMVLGAAAALALTIVACAVAHLDGRPMWVLYPFSVPMIGIMATPWQEAPSSGQVKS